jgi:hypothetical protein
VPVRPEEIPVAVFAFKRPDHLGHTLECLRAAGFRTLVGFSDGPRGPDDEEGVTRCREVLHAVDWADTEVVERPENMGSEASIVDGAARVLARSDRVLLLEDDMYVAPAYGPFVAAALDHYADEPRVAAVSGLRMPFSRRALRGYPYDALTLPRYFSWATAVWRRSWETFDFDRERLLARLRGSDVRLETAGSDLPRMVRAALVDGTLRDAYDVGIAACLVLNGQVSVVPTWNMVLHEGYEHATHVAAPPRWTRHARWETDFQPESLDRLRFPPPEPDPRIVKAFRVFRENPKGWSARRFVPRPARQAVRRIRGTYDVFR